MTSAKKSSSLKKPLVSLLRACWLIVCVAIVLTGSEAAVRALLRLSPLLFLSSLTSGGEAFSTAPGAFFSGALASISFLISTVVLIACAFRRRFFCRTLCPLGGVLDGAVKTRRYCCRKAGNFAKSGLVVRGNRLAFFFAAFWTLSFLLLPAPQVGVPSPGAASPLAFDPMSIFSEALCKPYGCARLLLLAVFFVASPFFWRTQACPCGLTQDALFLLPRTIAAVFLKREEKSSVKPCDEKRLGRRRVVALGLGATASLAVCWLPNRRRSNAAQAPFLPPNARGEDLFNCLCARCGRCAAVCPTQIIAPVSGSADPFMLTSPPQIRFERGEGFCAEGCSACANVCPTGAILPFSATDKSRIKIAVAQFELERCMLYFQRECSVCRRECPYEAIDFVWSDDAYARIPQISEEKCVGCGRCVAFCPGEPVWDDETGEYKENSDKVAGVKALSLKPIR